LAYKFVGVLDREPEEEAILRRPHRAPQDGYHHGVRTRRANPGESENGPRKAAAARRIAVDQFGFARARDDAQLLKAVNNRLPVERRARTIRRVYALIDRGQDERIEERVRGFVVCSGVGIHITNHGSIDLEPVVLV